MTYAATIVTMLEANAPLMAILTGGVHDYTGLGRKGLDRIQTAAAYNPQIGIIKPVCIVMEDEEVPTGEINSYVTGFVSTYTPVYMWIYQNGDDGYGRIIAAYDILYGLLNLQRIANGFQIMIKKTLKDQREPKLQDASCYEIVWTVYGFRRPA